jgi:acetylornithine aminotransferase/acetylornithine/N-succinyldiaminopimelate aminotransferase
MNTTATRELFDRHVIPTYGRFDLRLAKGAGARVWDEDGKAYLDFGAGIAVVSLGHCHPRVVKTMQEQVATLVHVSNLYYNRPQGLLAERLVRLVGRGGKVFFCNSGAEANEALYKLARKFGNEALPPQGTHTVGEVIPSPGNRHTVITMEKSFHGRTLAGIAATGHEKVKVGFQPLVEGFRQVPFNDGPALLADVLEAPHPAAILLEPIQGERGVYPASPEYLQTARDLCDKHEMLLMFDEVQCGLGRTGGWCGWEAINAEIAPDAISWAKGIAGGFPLGAVWVSDRPVRLKTGETKPLCDLLGPGSHGTTFGGTPLVSAGANEVLAVIEEEGLLQNAREMGAFAKASLEGLGSPLIEEVRGVGLMLGIQLVADFAERVTLPEGRSPSIHVVELLHAAGLLTVPSGTHAFRWLPPLNVTRGEIEEAAATTREVLQKLVSR